MSTIGDIITHEEQLEGNGAITNNPSDAGGRTQYGISEKSNPQAWLDGKVTEPEARAIYEAQYVRGPGFDKIADPTLQAQLVDYAVLSGPAIAIMRVQTIVGVPSDGVIGPKTLSAVNGYASGAKALNNKLAAARILMITRIVQKNPTQLQFLTGWCDRALSFMV